MRVDPHQHWRAVAATVAAAAALIAAPGTAGAATTCELSSGVLDVTMSADDDKANLDPNLGTIFVTDQSGLVTCDGGTPTMSNTAAVSVHNVVGVSNNDVRIFESNTFAPGPAVEAAENGGTPEIEIFVNLNDSADSSLQVGLDTTGGRVRIGTGGINPNAANSEVEPDADVFPSGVPLLRALGNSGGDLISARGEAGTGGPLSVGVEIAGLSGNDTLVGGEGNDTLRGDAGIDDLAGNGGGDVIDAGAGDNLFLSGGPGNDYLVPGSAGDPVRGAEGTDAVDYSAYLTTGVSVDLASTDQSIERVTGTNFNDVLRTGAGPNFLIGLQGGDVLEGRGGNDTFAGGEGNDALEARDGGPDTADCGPDVDTVTADPTGVDALAACETVRFPAAPATPPPPAPPPPPPQTEPDPPDADPDPSNQFRIAKARRNKKKGTAKLRVIVPGPGEVELAKTAKVKPRVERAEGAGRVEIAVKARRGAKRRLREQGKAKVGARVTYTPDGGAANTQGKTVKLIKR